MFILSSRSATVLVIFIVACIAFCLASVFGAMTGPISILPNDTDGGILDNLTNILDSNDTSDNHNTANSNSNSHSNNNNSQSSDNSNVETTTDDSGSSSNNKPKTTPSTPSTDDSSPNVETTTG